MASCSHASTQDLKPPAPSQAVYREDCTQCFDSIVQFPILSFYVSRLTHDQDDEAGLNVCLTCFNGGCAGDRDHASLHFKQFGHPLMLNIKRSRKNVQRDEPPHKISKLAITAETEEDIFETATHVICYACDVDILDNSVGNLETVIDGVMNAMTFSKREEVKAWEQEFIPCEHTLCLDQHEPKQIESQECGNLGCGRSQFGGMGGNSHGLVHSNLSSHGVAVKLGSITADGSADIYCYKCNEERVDPNLAAHLAHWGINLSSREKTEKSLMEMQVEHNMKWEFSMKTEDGKELTPLFGPGLTGLVNLGNSCYLSSVVQCIFDTAGFQQRYYHGSDIPPFCQAPAEDFETQMRKLADGLLSGRYSRLNRDIIASPESVEAPQQKGLAPAMFKHLVGRGHEEFSTMRQQDAFEFLTHVFKLVNLSTHPEGLGNPIGCFNFLVEQRLQCSSCQKVRYSENCQDNISIPVPARRLASIGDSSSEAPFAPVTLYDCIDSYTAEEKVELTCPSCGSKDGFTKRSSFKTLPQELVINARRFEMVNWVPTKLEIPVEVSDEPLDFSSYLSRGLKEGEELLPEVEEQTPTNAFVPHQGALDQLLGMGFPMARCEKALYMTGNVEADAAMNWLFAHMDDVDIDEPLDLGKVSATQTDTEQDPMKLEQLGEMGIDGNRAKIALRATNGDINRAIDWVFSHPDDVFETATNAEPGASCTGGSKSQGTDATPARYQLRSIVCHKGSSVHAGHYVAFVRKASSGENGMSWVMFNDEKVVKVDDIQDMKKFAYLYFFSRV
ncbi:hypothetical protein FE257_009777 [Aspergillus nanangensis]|uniref:Ubiquitin carboxyl-terminal hydrolase n=1 Tax=Aspergillus nanangensis TaxID=2582783 RepID=A0AAD4CJB6_ASPNN|nr:hypothetical protein FE257_009777 [Aspergillus nanangensis]